MERGEVIRFIILRTLGNFLVLFAVFGVIATFGPALYHEVMFRVIEFRGIQFVTASGTEQEETSAFGELLERRRAQAQTPQQNSGFTDILAGPQRQILIPKDTQFSIVIPKIGATSRVVPNVDSQNEAEYSQVLRDSIAHAKGSVFPGIRGNTYLFAHSAANFWEAGRNNAIFYLLKDLSPGDDVIIFFENQRHNYKIKESRIVDASDVDSLVKSQEGQKEVLILQTCWPPGTTWKRLLVFAEKI